jgi:xanthine dehydrogenase accessory factor
LNGNPRERIVLIGPGGIDGLEDAIVRLARILDFEVIVIAQSPMLSEKPDRLLEDLDENIAAFKFLDSDSVIVLNHSERDVEILHALSGIKLRYVGLLGDGQRVKDDSAALRLRGADEKFISSIKGPVGADIGARTPPEIALSIMTEVVATKYGKPVLRKQAKAT